MGYSPVLRQRFFNANGEPLSGGKLYSFDAGSSTPRATYTDPTCTTPNANPVVLDSEGYADVWIESGTYKFRLDTAADVTVWTKDNVPSIAQLFGEATGALVAVENLSDLTDPDEALENLGLTATAAQLNSVTGNLAAHITDTTDAHAASAITNTPSGNLAATTVQGALNELQTDVDTRATSAALTAHDADTTSVHGIADTSALSIKSATETLSGKTFSDPLTLDGQASTPANPSAGFYKLYAKDDGKVYKLNSAGTETELGAGAGGSGGKNYLETLYAGTSVSGINTYADAAATSPADGTGGTASVSAAALNTSTPLRGSSSIRLSKGAANEQGEGWSYDFTLDRVDYRGGKPVVIQFRYETSANYASGDVRMFVYDRDGAGTLLNVVSLTGDGSINASSNTTLYTGVFYPNSSNNDYRLIFHITSTNASAWDLDLIDLKVGPDSTVPGAIVEATTAYTPTFTGFGTVSDVHVYFSRFGDKGHVSGRFASGTPTADEARISLPSGWTTKTTMPANYRKGVGKWFRDNSSATTEKSGDILVENAVTYVTMGTNHYTPALSPFTKRNGSSLVQNGETVSFEFVVELADKAASAALSTTETMLSSTRVTATSTAATSFANATETDVPFATETVDNMNAFDGTTFTAPVTGRYFVRVSIGVQGFTINTSHVWYLNVTNASNTQLALLGASSLSSADIYPNGSTVLSLTKGDQIKVRFYQGNGASRTRSTTATHNQLDITLLPDPSIFSVYGVSEYQESASSSQTNWPISANTFGDLTSLSLSPGEWDITAIVNVMNNGAVSANNLFVGITTTSGNSSAGLADGVNSTNFYNPGSSGARWTVIAPAYRVVVTTPTTYYLKANYVGTITNFVYNGYRLSARRIK